MINVALRVAVEHRAFRAGPMTTTEAAFETLREALLVAVRGLDGVS